MPGDAGEIGVEPPETTEIGSREDGILFPSAPRLDVAMARSV
jgi:hypothetical protein